MQPISQWRYIGGFLLLILVCGGLAFAATRYYQNHVDEPTQDEQGNEQEGSGYTNHAQDDDAIPSNTSGRATIYATVGMHVERAGGTNNPDYVNNEDRFWEDRNLLLEFATMLKEEGLAFDFMSDVTFLEAVVKYDKNQSNTNGKNIIQYLSEDLGVSIDPHAHETAQSNYADVAYLVDQLGVTPTGLVGGFIVDQGVERFRSPMQAKSYPYTWTPTILWGGGTSLHKDESQYWTSGIWRPKSNSEFTVDDPSALPDIGNYKSSWDGLDHLLAKNASGVLDPAKIYTITIMTNLRDINQSGYIDTFQKEIQARKSYMDSGEVAWLTLPEVVEVWKTTFGSQPNRLMYDGSATTKTPFSAGTSTGTQASGTCGNNACEALERQTGLCPADCQ